MKIFLIGYEGSKQILPASSYLIEKYLPQMFDVNFLNFGDYDENNLYRGNYVKLDDTQVDGSSAWSKYLREYFETLDDEYVIFALDDFLLCRELDEKVYDALLNEMNSNKKVACAKLGISPSYRPHEYQIIREEDGVSIFYLNDNASYSASTQYSIWRRESLIDILYHTVDAWSFELSGSEYLNSTGQKVIGSTTTCLPYSESSAMSNRQPSKISVLGVPNETVDDMIEKKILCESDLILGQPIQASAPSYIDCKDKEVFGIEDIHDDEYKRYCNFVRKVVKNNDCEKRY